MTQPPEPDFLGWAPEEPQHWDAPDAAPTPAAAPAPPAPTAQPAPTAPRPARAVQPARPPRAQAPAPRPPQPSPPVAGPPGSSGRVPTPPPYGTAGRPQGRLPVLFWPFLVGAVLALVYTASVLLAPDSDDTMVMLYGGMVVTVLLGRAAWWIARR